MLLGYCLNATDTNKNMYGDDFEFGPDPKNKCLKYRSIYEINYLPGNFEVPKNTKSDFLETADGFHLVSEKVIKLCETNKYKNIEFIPLPGNPKYYWMKPHTEIEYDFKRRDTRFLNYSKKCKGYREIIGADPVCLKDNKPLGDNFYRTDLCFGSINGKHPSILLGVETLNKIKRNGLKGIYVDEILDKYKWEK